SPELLKLRFEDRGDPCIECDAPVKIPLGLSQPAHVCQADGPVSIGVGKTRIDLDRGVQVGEHFRHLAQSLFGDRPAREVTRITRLQADRLVKVRDRELIVPELIQRAATTIEAFGIAVAKLDRGGIFLNRLLMLPKPAVRKPATRITPSELGVK